MNSQSAAAVAISLTCQCTAIDSELQSLSHTRSASRHALLPVAHTRQAAPCCTFRRVNRAAAPRRTPCRNRSKRLLLLSTIRRCD
ncbi:hypothetical protein PR003_g8781 [Phytophthora rubi]|uniref:Uncharacterized protein n=1 Tax=Phytophthora rubi TaxID=129364 RepID=A0A6A3N429_9STRA|nr:hypothetical protein PR002_g8326 [Phytophthora rubi]KAE9038149.1 hypothetical protein PR001_g8072 [Phytophthora rubi]KAE9343808.1 hypothetical protein PR003_g8781 [Phytophthora rubi]